MAIIENLKTLKEFYLPKQIEERAGVKVFYAPTYLDKCGIIIAGTDNVSERIWVDDIYIKCLSENAKNVIIYHEIGHKINGDVKLDKESIQHINDERRKGELPQEEIDADLYAYSQMGILAVMGMAEIRDFFKSLLDDESLVIYHDTYRKVSEDFEKRINVILNMYNLNIETAK